MDPVGYLDTLNFSSIGANIFFWIGYILIFFLVGALFLAGFYYMMFDYKVLVFPLYGGGKGGYTIGKPKSNRVRWDKNRTYWQSIFPLFNKRKREPFKNEYIYQGKQIYVFEVNGEWVPGKITVSEENSDVEGTINPVPYYIRNWQSLQYKSNAIEFAEHSFWEDNKYFIMGLATVVVCCAAAAFTVWITYKFAQPGAENMARLAAAIKDFGTIQGVTPPPG